MCMLLAYFFGNVFLDQPAKWVIRFIYFLIKSAVMPKLMKYFESERYKNKENGEMKLKRIPSYADNIPIYSEWVDWLLGSIYDGNWWQIHVDTNGY